MYISLHRSGKDKRNVYVRVMESKRDKNGKVVKTVIKNLGRLSDLLAEDPQALEKLKAQYSTQREQKKSAVAEERLRLVAEALAVSDKPSLADDGFPALCYGHYPLRSIWEDFLHFDRKINYLGKTSAVRFDVDRALQYLVFHKLMHPCSVKSAFEDKDNFLGDPARGLSLDQFYATYDFVAAHHNEIFGWVNKRLDESYGENRATLVFYDVTNAYFEASMTDAEREMVRNDFPEIVQQRACQWFDAGLLPPDCFDESGWVVADKLPAQFWEEITEDKLKYLRMRGPSKEHRFDLPLVSIALVIDRNGFPMDVCVYAGNSSEFKTMEQSIKELKAKYKIGASIVVADRGLNSAGNLNMLQNANLGFLMAQKVSKFPRDLTNQMLDRTRYTPFDENDPEAAGYQVVRNWKRTGSSGKAVECTLVLTYDEKRRRRDEAILDAWVEIIKAKQAAGVKLGPRKTSWAALAKTEAGIEQQILGIDEEVLAKKKALCGFAAFVYKQPPAQNEDNDVKVPPLTGEEIASTYRVLNQIETCFRMLKSNIGLRPMFVWTAQHIKAHVDICVLALLLMRIIQKQLQEKAVKLSPQRISEVLQEMKVLVLKGLGESTSFLSIAPRCSLRRNHNQMNTEEILQLIAERRVGPSERSQVMSACGLRPIPRACSRSELANALGTRFADDQAALPALIAAML